MDVRKVIWIGYNSDIQLCRKFRTVKLATQKMNVTFDKCEECEADVTFSKTHNLEFSEGPWFVESSKAHSLTHSSVQL